MGSNFIILICSFLDSVQCELICQANDKKSGVFFCLFLSLCHIKVMKEFLSPFSVLFCLMLFISQKILLRVILVVFKM